MLSPNTNYPKILNVAMMADYSEHTESVLDHIVSNGSQCTVYHSVAVLQEALYKATYDVILVDWDRCGSLDGNIFIDWVRNTHNSDVPVIVISASKCERTIVDALYSGADNFLVKPLRRNELLARLHALVRRVQPEHAVFTYPPYSVDVSNREVRLDDEVVRLTHLEYELAVFLFRNLGRVLSRKQLLAAIWNMPNVLDTRTVDTHISHLRIKLKMRDTQRWVLASVYQRGYCLQQKTGAH